MPIVTGWRRVPEPPARMMPLRITTQALRLGSSNILGRQKVAGLYLQMTGNSRLACDRANLLALAGTDFGGGMRSEQWGRMMGSQVPAPDTPFEIVWNRVGRNGGRR